MSIRQRRLENFEALEQKRQMRPSNVFRPTTMQLIGSQRCTLQIRFYKLISNKTAIKLQEKYPFCAYCLMRPMVHHIEKYNREKLFDENDITNLNGSGK